MSRSLSSDSQSKSSGSTPENMKVDFSKLDMPALLKYCQHYNLVHANPNPSKEQLIDIIQKHFMSQQVDEHQVIGRLSNDSQSKSSGSTPENMKVDFSKLDMPALLKYCQHYNLVHANPNPSKEQLIDIIQKHFMSQQVDEHQVIGRLSNDSQSKSSGSTPENMKVDFSKLGMPALLKYCQHYNLVHANPYPSKEQLIDIVQKHFMSQQVDEHQVIVKFAKALQSEEPGNTASSASSEI